MGEAHSKGGKHKGIPNVAKKNLIARWRNRQFTQQLFAVARHDERADGLYSYINGVRWTQTDDFRRWPFDPPLSDAGVEAARSTAQRMNDIAQASSCQIHVIVSSPYFRCIQTAVEMCVAFGPKTRLLVDYSLGEIYGPSIMGQTEPHSPVRPLEHTMSYCRSRGVCCHPKVIGKWPTWPENVRTARKRFANIFLTYLQRGSVTRRNFMLVGHADCVAASLSLMPSQAEHSIEKVDYGGFFLGKRQRKQENQPKPSKKPKKKSLVAIVPGGDVDDDNAGAPDPDTPTLLIGNRVNHSAWLDEEFHDEGMGSSEEQVELPEASDGWEVLTLNIDVHKKAMQSSGSRRSSFSKRVSALAENSRFSRERIDKLLGELIPATPLGTVASNERHSELENGMNDADPRIGTQQTVPTILSFSTFLFGASDVGNMSDVGSEFANSRVPTFAEDCRVPTNPDLDSYGIVNLSPRASMLSSVTRSSGRHTSRESNTLREHQRQGTLDELPSPMLLDRELPSKMQALEKVLLGSPDKIANIDETTRHSRPTRSFSIPGGSIQVLEKVEEKSEPMESPLVTGAPKFLATRCVGKPCASEEKSASCMSNITNSSLLRRRQLKLASPSLCSTSQAEEGQKNCRQVQRLDVEQVLAGSISQLRSSVHQQLPVSLD